MSILMISCCSTSRNRRVTTSFFEIEKSTLAGKPYQTGGGRTVDTNVIDMMMTWMVNNDRESLHGGALQRDEAGHQDVSLQASPNTELQIVADSVGLAASPDQVWAVIGQFGDLMWHPLAARRKSPDRVSVNCARSKRSTASRSSNALNPSITRKGYIATQMSVGFESWTTREHST